MHIRLSNQIVWCMYTFRRYVYNIVYILYYIKASLRSRTSVRLYYFDSTAAPLGGKSSFLFRVLSVWFRGWSRHRFYFCGPTVFRGVQHKCSCILLFTRCRCSTWKKNACRCVLVLHRSINANVLLLALYILFEGGVHGPYSWTHASITTGPRWAVLPGIFFSCNLSFLTWQGLCIIINYRKHISEPQSGCTRNKRGVAAHLFLLG